MVAQTLPATDRQPWYRRGFGRNSAGEPSGPSSGGSPGGSGGGAVGGSADAPSGASSGTSPGGSPVTSSGSFDVQVVDDSVFDVELDGWMARSPEAYARAVIEHLQSPEYRLLHGQYVSSKMLEQRLYADFLERTGWPPMPWRTVAVALGKVTRKRDKEYRSACDGEWKRRSITQFLIPRPNAKATRAA
jgi:hypothetical protein